MKVLMEKVRRACLELWEVVPAKLGNMASVPELPECSLYELLDELGVDEAEALCGWYNARTVELEDVPLLARVQVVRLVCDNCGEAEHRCYPPDDDWSKFQGCQSPTEVGYRYETPRGDVFVCTDCYGHNPAFQMLTT